MAPNIINGLCFINGYLEEREKMTKYLVLFTGILILGLIATGCFAVPAGGCPYCGYPPGVTIDGERVTCQRCGSGYAVYLDGSVRTISGPTRHVGPAVPTNNTDAAQRNLNQTGQILLEGLRK